MFARIGLLKKPGFKVGLKRYVRRRRIINRMCKKNVHSLEKFATKCRKTKTKLIIPASQKGHTVQWTNRNSSQIHAPDGKRKKMQANELQLCLVLPLIDREVARVFLEQSLCVAMQDQNKRNYFRHSSGNRSIFQFLLAALVPRIHLQQPCSAQPELCAISQYSQ